MGSSDQMVLLLPSMMCRLVSLICAQRAGGHQLARARGMCSRLPARAAWALQGMLRQAAALAAGCVLPFMCAEHRATHEQLVLAVGGAHAGGLRGPLDLADGVHQHQVAGLQQLQLEGRVASLAGGEHPLVKHQGAAVAVLQLRATGGNRGGVDQDMQAQPSANAYGPGQAAGSCKQGKSKRLDPCMCALGAH